MANPFCYTPAKRWLCLAVLTAALVPLVQLSQAQESSQGKNPPRKEKTKTGEKAKPLTADLSPLPAAVTKEEPESLEDLKQIQERAKEVAERVIKATVGVRIGAGQGSGVIISEDGYVLTAAHVSGAADQSVLIILHDGRQIKGKTLGANKRVDSGLIKITDKGPWPFVEMGNSEKLQQGNWCLAMGHPRGYKSGRPPVLRLGRVQDNFKTLIRSDCTLVGGDSGGPLFDLNGKVIGIHSRIGPSISYNIHVPIDNYIDEWDRLVAGEVFPNNDRAYLGVQGDPDGKECKILKVYPDSPAEKAGIMEGDIIVAFAGKKIGSFEDLVNETSRQKPNATVTVELVREGQAMELKIALGKRSD